MLLIIQEVKQSNTSFKERKNITKSSLRRKVKSAADNIYLPNCFEILNCETEETDENDQPYEMDSFIVCSDTINRYSKYEQSNRPKVVANRLEEKVLFQV